MKRGTLSRHFLAAVAVWFGLTTGFASRCVGQSDPATPQLFQITVYKIKPDMVAEWESLVKAAIPALKKAGVPMVSFWQTAIFGENEWVAATPIAKFAEYDGANPFVRALGEAGAMRLHAMAVKCLAEPARGYAVRFRRDLSINQPMTEPPAIATVTSIHVAFGKGQEFEAIVKGDVLPAMKKAGLTQFWVYEAVQGGDVNGWTIVTPYKNFAEVDVPSPMVRAIGQEGAQKIAAKSAGIVVSMERSVMRYRVDLSYHEAPSQ
jgi:hypothetical protein